jgi:hypothetical protein
MLKRLMKRSALRERNNSSCAARVDSDKVLRPAARLMLASDLLLSVRFYCLEIDLIVAIVTYFFTFTLSCETAAPSLAVAFFPPSLDLKAAARLGLRPRYRSMAPYASRSMSRPKNALSAFFLTTCERSLARFRSELTNERTFTAK